MLRAGAKGRHAAIVRELEMPVPFDLGQFVAGLERQRHRPIRLRPFSSGRGFRAVVDGLGGRASFGLSYHGRAETEQRAFRMLGLLAADFPAWNLAAVLETDTDDAEELLEQLVDAVLADIAGGRRHRPDPVPAA